VHIVIAMVMIASGQVIPVCPSSESVMSVESNANLTEGAAPKRSGVEVVKENSRALRGTIADELGKASDKFADADKNLLKFHGTYQQEDRDARKGRRQDGLGKHMMFMVRCKIPGGRMTPDQYLGLDELAGRWANGTLRITSRQGIQFHGVVKQHLKETIAGINATLLTTLGACGDVNRNVMCCPAPHHQDQVRLEMYATAAQLAAHFAPRSGAYHEIWLNGLQLADGKLRNNGTPQSASANPPSDEEPIYGKVYLPRKFKMGLALPEDNCVDVYSQDLGLLALAENGHVAGYNLLVGGGSGMTHGNANTFPYLGKPVAYVAAQEVLAAAEAIVKIFRDHGNRADRKRARIKYLVHDWGVEKLREVLAQYLGRPIAPPRPVEVSGYDLHLGWHPQGDGKWYYGISIENGRIKDAGPLRLRSGLRAIIQRFRPDLRTTPCQDLLLCNLSGSGLPALEAMLAEYGIARPETLSQLRRYSLACPAVPTCGLAISEAERALPDILDELDGTLRELGLEEETLSVRMTGCPNGCVRPYQSDIGIVGRSGDKYMLFVGGNVLGHRLNFELADLVPRGRIVATLRPLLTRFKDERQSGESFGDFCQRLGEESARALAPTAVREMAT
jgi:sulfite reductase (ferredoxin)